MAEKAQHQDVDAELRAQVDALRSDVNRLTELLVHAGKTEASELVDRVEGVGRRAADEAGARIATARAAGDAQVSQAQALVRQHPLTALACAAGVGFLLARVRANS